jgi:hypothetical protein
MALPVQVWLAKHPRFKLHFIPTSSSWLHLVERRFARLHAHPARCIHERRRSPIEARIAERNTKPKPFEWTEADSIITEKGPARSKKSPCNRGFLRNHPPTRGRTVPTPGTRPICHAIYVRPTQRRPLLPVQVGRRPEPTIGGSQLVLKALEAHEAPAASRANDSVCHRSPGGARQ